MELRVRHADGQLQRIVLDAGKPLRFGTHPSADVKLREANVLPVAFGIVFKKGAFQVVPSKAAGSVQVNGQQVKKAHLQPGDVVQVKKTRVEVVGDAVPAHEELPADLPPDILADDILGDDAGLDPLGSSSDSLLTDSVTDLGDLTDPLAEIPADPIGSALQQTASTTQATASKRTTAANSAAGPSTFARVLQSGWFQAVLTSVVVVPLVVFVVIFFSQLPSDQQVFDAANSLYRSGDWSASVQAFDKFLTWNDESAFAGEARVKLDLARLRLALEQGQDASELLQDTRDALERWGVLRRQSAAEEGLADVLPPLVADLVRDGQNAAERSAAESANAAFAQAREALDLIYEFVPPRLQEQQGVDQLLTQLMGQERQFNQPSELRKAVSLIDSAGAEGGIEAAYIERNVFLGQQPSLVANGRLAASMRAIARAEATRVTFETTNDQAIIKTKSDDEVECQVLFSTNRDSSDEVARSERLAMVIAPTSNAVFAMDAVSLDLLWRYPVGATDASPVACRDAIGRGVILGDQRSQNVVRLDATTGELVWSCSVPQFVGQPKVVREQAIIATADGQLVEIDLAVGRVTQRIRFDQGIRCGPVVVGAGERLVQVGDHSVIYLVSREERRCLHSHYLGHELGSVSLPPLISGGHVFLIEKVGRDRSEVHVVRMGDQFQIVASFAIDGRVATMPVFLSGVLCVATTDGQLHTIRHNPEDKRRPFRLGPTSAISDGVEGHRHPTFLAVKAGRIWAGGDGVTILEPASNDSDPPRRKRLDNSLRVSQPLDVSSSSDGLVICGFTPESEFQVRRWDARNQTVKAEATLAVPTAARPLVGGGRRELWNLTEGGSLYKVAWDEIAQGSSSNLVVAPALTLVDEGGRVEAFRESVKSDDFGVFATRADHNELVFVPLAVGNSLQRVKVAGPLVGPAVPFGARWMVAFQHGAIGLLDNPSGEFATESFLPGTGLSDSLQWSQPIVTADHRAVVYDGDRRLFSIRHTSGLEKLDLELETALESSLRKALVRVGAVLWSVNQQNQLLAFNAASLELSATVDLPADVQWGPVAIGGQALLTTEDGTLICVADGKQPLWQAKYEHGPVTGACELISGEIALATGGGVLWRVRADTGEQVGATVELKQPLAFGPFIFGDHLSVMSTDGTLLVLKQTTQGESDGSGNKEVSGP